MPSTEPQEVRDFVVQVAQLQQRRKAAMTAMTAATGTATSDDASVTVNAAGVLVDVSLTARARPGPTLAGEIVQLAGQARQRALNLAADDVGGILGEDSRAVAALRRQGAGMETLGDAATQTARRQYGEVFDGD